MAAEDVSPVVIQNNNSTMRMDGNNVDIEAENVELARNTIYYYTLTEQINSEFTRLSMGSTKGSERGGISEFHRFQRIRAYGAAAAYGCHQPKHAHASTTRTAPESPTGGASQYLRKGRNHFSSYHRRRDGRFRGRRVVVSAIATDMSDFKSDMIRIIRRRCRGYVQYPNVDEVTELVDMMAATRAYEANVTALNARRNMRSRLGDRQINTCVDTE
jgi:flagellar basal body rod protein FlgC